MENTSTVCDIRCAPGGAGAVSAETPLREGRFPGCLSISVRVNGSGPADTRSYSVR